MSNKIKLNDISAGMILTLLELGSKINLGSSQIISLEGDSANGYIHISANGFSQGLWSLTKEGVVEALYDAVKILEDENEFDPDTVSDDLTAIKKLIKEVAFDPNKPLDAYALKNQMEGHLDAVKTMANTYMLNKGDSSDECQRMLILNNLSSMYSAVNGIEANDLEKAPSVTRSNDNEPGC